MGSLLGDFARGVDSATVSTPVREGWRHHLAVDAFTDQHPDVLASKRLFSKQRRRFAGVALDILYDHYLLRHWHRYSSVEADTFINQVYEELRKHRPLMPEKMQTVTSRIVQYDWFRSYQSLDNIGFALDRVADRIRFRHSFGGMIEEIKACDQQLESHFLSFFPELLDHASSAYLGRRV